MSRRLPLIPTVMTLVMLAVLIGLGVWQLQRAEWKRGLITDLKAAQSLPPLEPGDYLRAMTGEASVQYRRAELPCNPGKVLPYDLKGGSSATGVSGYMVLVSCRPNNRPPDIVAVAGWTRRPDAASVPLIVDTVFRGTIIERPYGKAEGRPQFMLIAENPVPSLEKPRLPTPADLPDNHMSYALQWFGFAATLAIIYAIWLRRRLRSGSGQQGIAAPPPAL